MKKLHQGGCHCGAVRFECRLDPAESTSRCNCSVCAKGRFWKAIARKDDFRILQGENDLSDYQFGGKNIHHLFCRSAASSRRRGQWRRWAQPLRRQRRLPRRARRGRNGGGHDSVSGRSTTPGTGAGGDAAP